uniref:Helicase like transcription factor n=1 Tax=Propithecus coquereli TaxID=379532 RepID=A0A2K6FZQ4_PROCO
MKLKYLPVKLFLTNTCPREKDFVLDELRGKYSQSFKWGLLGNLQTGQIMTALWELIFERAVNNNEMVALQREPNNSYDKNAIKVNNVNGNQVGYLKKDHAAALAYIMDNKLAQIEGVVPFGANNAFTMPLHMTFWGKEENRKAVLDHLKKHGLKLGSAPKSKHLFNLPSMNSVVSQRLKTEFDKLFEDLKEDDKTHEMEPAEAIETPLLPHQKQALAWMVSRENSKELPPFWEQRNDLYYNTITNFSEKDRPENVHGGILADDMGLGKTLTAIAVILTNFHDGKPLPIERLKKNLLKKECNFNDKSVKLGGSNASEKSNDVIPVLALRKTAVQCIESSDSEEIETKELPQKMKGKLKNVQSETKSSVKAGSSKVKEDVVFASSAAEGSKKTDAEQRPRTTLIICPLSVLSNWIHIVSIDIKKYDSLINCVKYCFTYLYFLIHMKCLFQTKGNSPLHSIRWLRVILDEGHAIRNPNAQQTKAVLDLEAERRWVLTGNRKISYITLCFILTRRLQCLIKNITLRRTKTSKIKGKPVLELPERKVFIQHITLSDEERKIYQSVKNEGRATIGRYFNEGTVLAHYADVLGLLLRLRQICCHTRLLTNAPHAKCPLCRNEIHRDNLLECTPEELACDGEKKSNMEWTSSSKINALMHALIDLRKKNPNTKSLVVSQFTTFLSLIETPLKASGFVFTRLDGSMAQKERVESIQCFQNTEAGSPTVMLLSLKAGGVGLNLSAASRVFLMDPAWNPAAEDQCFDRCHRLGQKQEVIITKFIVKDSVEENMMKIQNRKRELAAGAFGTKKTNADEMKQAKINEIRTLIDL